MSYIDGFVIPVPTARKNDYLDVARQAADLFLKHGAVSVRECWGVDIPPGETTSFPMAVKLKDDETVVFSWVEWPSKDARDKAMPGLSEDMQADMKIEDMPFDGQRLIMGSFETLLQR